MDASQITGDGSPARVRPLGAPPTLLFFAAWSGILYAATRPGMAWLAWVGARPDVA
jgi:hypothetical protein